MCIVNIPAFSVAFAMSTILVCYLLCDLTPRYLLLSFASSPPPPPRSPFFFDQSIYVCLDIYMARVCLEFGAIVFIAFQ